MKFFCDLYRSSWSSDHLDLARLGCRTRHAPHKLSAHTSHGRISFSLAELSGHGTWKKLIFTKKEAHMRWDGFSPPFLNLQPYRSASSSSLPHARLPKIRNARSASGSPSYPISLLSLGNEKNREEWGSDVPREISERSILVLGLDCCDCPADARGALGETGKASRATTENVSC